MLRIYLTKTLCITISALVFLSSLHATHVLSSLAAQRNVDDPSLAHHAKVSPDLHHHMDKSGMQLVKDAGDQQQYYADYRTLRVLRNAKKDLPYRYRLAGWLQDSWLQLTTIFG